MPDDTNRSPDQEEIQRCLHQCLTDPAAAANEMVLLRRRNAQLDADCRRSAAAAEQMYKTLEDLLRPKAALYPLERFYLDDQGRPCALVNLNGQRRELPVADHVDLDILTRLAPWQCVKVHPTEMIVVGSDTDESLWSMALGEMVTYKATRDGARGLVTVSRFGRDEEVVRLAPSLCGRPLAPGDRLMLCRDNPRWAIDIVPAQQVESRYEISVSQITTRFDDLAGLDGVIDRIVEDWLMRLVYKEIGERFDLEPLRGMILYSYKPGMGKTALVRAMIRWLYELGQVRGFDVVLYNIQPNALKSMWHGEDARLVRDEVCGTIRARLTRPRTRPLVVVVVFDEVESLGKRTGGNDRISGYYAPAANDAVQALLAGMDGIEPLKASSGPPADVVWIGLTNRPDALDDALKRPGRMGDLVIEMPDYGEEAAAQILAVYARAQVLPWYLGGEIRREMEPHEVFARILRPAVTRVFATPVLRYATEGRASTDVTAGEVLAGVNYKNAMSRAKRRAARRMLRREGTAAVGFEDVADGLLEEARTVAGQLDADRPMLERHLHLKVPVLRTVLVPEHEMVEHRYLRAVAS